MDNKEVIEAIRKLASDLGPGKVIKLEDIRTVPRLNYYVDVNFGGIGNALKEAGLPSSTLAAKMVITNEELLRYLDKLQNHLGRRPTTLDLRRDNKIYKEFADTRFSPNIFKTRFKGFKNALLQLEVTTGETSRGQHAKKEEKNSSEIFQNKRQYFGKAAELHVSAELIYRGYQAANIPIDEGLDILAVKNNKTFYFQVKHKDLGNNQSVEITRSSFERTGSGSVYYVFVLLDGEKRDFLIVPYHIVNDWIRTNLAKESGTKYLLNIKKGGNELKLENVILNKYLSQWDDIK